VVDDVIDGRTIRAGTTIAVLPYSIHRHPELWDEPERFEPQRFTPERIAERHKYAWIAFGLGQHKCLGKDFALMEAQLILAMLMQRYRMEAVPGRVAEPELSGTLRPKGGVWVTLTPRE
jgi:cytochrome P450